jgi:dTDP-4-amino-4,6-dideoxygalactose transaminase
MGERLAGPGLLVDVGDPPGGRGWWVLGRLALTGARLWAQAGSTPAPRVGVVCPPGLGLPGLELPGRSALPLSSAALAEWAAAALVLAPDGDPPPWLLHRLVTALGRPGADLERRSADPAEALALGLAVLTALVPGVRLYAAEPARSVAAEPIPVVLPPRPHRPGVLVDRQQAAAWSGEVKGGQRWTTALADAVRQRLRDGLPDGADRDDPAVLATASGTAALRIGYDLAAGPAGAGDLALLPAFTFAATAESLIQLGYRLRLVDVDPQTWTMDPRALDAALHECPRARLVVPVDALGAPADHTAIAAVAGRHGVPVVADSAPAFGARCAGRPIGRQHPVHAFSLSFAKPLIAGGVGGLLVLDPALDRPGAANWPRSSLMPEPAAIYALDQLDQLDLMMARRQAVAEAYDRVLVRHRVPRQQARPGDRHGWTHYVIKLPDPAVRDQVQRRMAARGVETKPYYHPGLQDPAWRHGFDVGAGRVIDAALPISRWLAGSVLALPMSSELGHRQLARVVEALDESLDQALDQSLDQARGRSLEQARDGQLDRAAEAV